MARFSYAQQKIREAQTAGTACPLPLLGVSPDGVFDVFSWAIKTAMRRVALMRGWFRSKHYSLPAQCEEVSWVFNHWGDGGGGGAAAAAADDDDDNMGPDFPPSFSVV